MKQLLSLLVFSLILFGCNTPTTSDTAKSDSVTIEQTIAYPFTPKYSLKWQRGDEKNALIVLNCLKHYVDGDIKGAFADIADTVEFIADKFHFKGGKDSLMTIMTGMRGELAAVSKVFDTWITTYYPENKDTWVTLWYTETWTDKKGKTDSLYYADDVLLKDGKIRIYDEKSRQFPVAKGK